MSETKFTKGDWRVTDSSFVYALNNNGVNQFTCLVQTSMGGADNMEIKANANLIAAAPKMYELLERLTNHKNCKKDIIHLLGEADNLLAKARGEK